jgi:hypothetical protein
MVRTSPKSSELASAHGTYAALKRHHPKSPDVVHAARDLAAAKLADYISRVVDAAPPLTPAQRDRLALLLKPADAA